MSSQDDCTFLWFLARCFLIVGVEVCEILLMMLVDEDESLYIDT